mgnify:CR=1 FL=1
MIDLLHQRVRPRRFLERAHLRIGFMDFQRQAADRRVQPWASRCQRAVHGVVGDDEQARDDHGRQHPQGDDGEGIIKEDEPGDDQAVHDQISAEVGQTLPGWVVVGLGGDDIENGLQGALF